MKQALIGYAIFCCLLVNPAIGGAIVLCLESHGAVAVEPFHEAHPCDHGGDAVHGAHAGPGAGAPHGAVDVAGAAFGVQSEGGTALPHCGPCIDLILLAPGVEVVRAPTAQSTLTLLADAGSVQLGYPGAPAVFVAGSSREPSPPPLRDAIRTVVLLT